jgi:predicted dehydrogenase
MLDPSATSDRRGLLEAAGLAVVAAGLLGSLSSGGKRAGASGREDPDVELPQPPQKKTGYAIVGLGKLALEEILPAFGKSARCRPAALVSGHPDKARKVAEHYGIDLAHVYDYAGFDRLKDDASVEVVYIALPNSMHAEYTVRALNAGKHVLCEKPMATSVRDCERMIEAGKRAKKKLMIAYRLHHEPYNQRAMEIAAEKVHGPIGVFESVNVQNVHAPNIRLSKELGGGPLGDVGVYCINAARYVLREEPVEVTGMHRWVKDDPRFREVPASTTFQLRYPSGALAVCACGFDGAEARRFRALCAKGWFELDPAFSYRNLRLREFDGKQLSEPALEPVDHFAREMDHLAECAASGKEPKTPGEEGLADMKIMEAIERAATSGRVEKV